MTSPTSAPLTFSIDWEDFGQLMARDHLGVEREPLNDIDRQTGIILDLLAETGTRATFFALGMLARHKQGLLRKIHESGHEVALHGMSHMPYYEMKLSEVEVDLRDGIALVEDTIGSKVHGFRAPYFSINRDSLHILDLIAELGFSYDSSIFPIKMPRYGIDGFPADDALYALPGGAELVELPLTALSWMGRKWPVAGGSYFRVLPRPLIREIYKRVARHDGAKMIYMHPYEFDTHAIDAKSNFPEEARLSRPRAAYLSLRWNLRRSSITNSVKMLLDGSDCITCKERADDVKSHTERPRLLGRA